MRKKFLSICSLFMAVGLFATSCQLVFPQTSASNSSSAGQSSSFKPETSASNSSSSEQAEVYKYIDVSYGSHPLQTMDIYIPKGAKEARYPVVVTLHGGEWWSGDKKDIERYTSTILASDCIHVNMNYRLLGNGIVKDFGLPYEQMLTDIDVALDYLVQNATQYRIDTSRAGIAGYSSGGHLALLYAYTKTNAPIPIQFVISEAGPANFLDPKTFTEDGELWLHEGHDGHEDIELVPVLNKAYRYALIGAVAGVKYGEDGWEEAWEKVSPAYAVTPTAPKTYLFYGSHDPSVPVSHAEFLKNRHPNCTLYEILNATHDLYADPIELRNFHTRLSEILEEL